jgi:hypothetical protein
VEKANAKCNDLSERLAATNTVLAAMKKKYKNFRDWHPDNALSVAWKKAQDQTF